jgi:hypothetical protein
MAYTGQNIRRSLSKDSFLLAHASSKEALIRSKALNIPALIIFPQTAMRSAQNGPMMMTTTTFCRVRLRLCLNKPEMEAKETRRNTTRIGGFFRCCRGESDPQAVVTDARAVDGALCCADLFDAHPTLPLSAFNGPRTAGPRKLLGGQTRQASKHYSGHGAIGRQNDQSATSL